MNDKWCYSIMHNGRAFTFPRVTQLLKDVFNKEGLIWWAAWAERRAVMDAVAEVATAPGALVGGTVFYDRVEKLLPKSRAFVKAKDEAADIGTQAHALIQWHTRKQLGLDVEVEPAVSEPATRCVLEWLDWCERVRFKPVLAERIVYCRDCGVAGTVDSVAIVNDRVTTVDYKSGKAIYPEAFVQVNFYDHLLAVRGEVTEARMVVRLPKYADHPPLEAVEVPVIPQKSLNAVIRTWTLARQLNEQPVGDVGEGCRG